MIWRLLPIASVVLVVVAGCVPSAPTENRSGGEGGGQQAPRTKSLTIGVTTGVQAMSILGASTTVGGWGTVSELHSNGLITSDVHTRALVGRLAEGVPSLEDGSISVLPDGRMKVIYKLRREVTWQDGAPFTAHDLVFSYTFMSNPGIPSNLNEGVNQMAAAEALDDHTFVTYFREPYYLGGALGLRRFWPQPAHVLREPFEQYLATGDSDPVVNHPYWTSDYVHLGPFRLRSFDPGEGTDYEAYGNYFLGRPKVDVVRVRTYSDQNTLFAHLLAGSVDILADTALSTDLAVQLKEQWDSSGEGTLFLRSGGTRFLSPQMRLSVQQEPAVLDPRVRAALYHAIDREELTSGTGFKEQAAWSLLPPGDRLYEATKDGFRRYAYDPDRAKAILRDLGWAAGTDGVLRNAADGRPFRTQIWVTGSSRAWEMPVFADFWRRIGLEVEEHQIPGPQARDNELRASYPGWEPSSSGAGDSVLGRLEGPAAAPANRWTGNRGGFEEPRAQELLARYYTALSEPEQFQAMNAISDYVVAELPFLVTYYNTDLIGMRRGIAAFDDLGGGAQAGQPYGTYTRNAHLWGVQ
ncbi:MAG: hypothetical protein GEU73_00175 [Chloroflexi bacterium]|nr:hypothetical protein [Chloroflexota bacterium]